jgi:hypothetical protein
MRYVLIRTLFDWKSFMAEKIRLASDETSRRRNFLMNVLYPMCRTIGNMLRLDGEKIDDYFIERNNRIVASSKKERRAEDMLLVLPHCLQNWECPNRINADIRNCKACGKCSIPELIKLGDRYNVRMCLVGGGTAARRSVYDHRPSFVIAVACERDMISGIRDAMPLPLWGVLNERPNGPCRNTGVDLARVEEALENLIGNNKPAGRTPKSEEP